MTTPLSGEGHSGELQVGAVDASHGLREQQLRLVTDAVPVLISYVDAQQRYRFNNRAYEDWFGRPRRDVYGQHLGDVLGEEAYAAVRPYAERALAGERVSYETPLPSRDGSTRYVAATYVPHVDKNGVVLGFFALVTDLTERKRAEDALRFLADASAVLSSSLDYRVTLSSLARLAVPQLADACIVDMLDDVGELRRLAVASVDEARAGWVWEVGEAPLDRNAPHGPAQVLRTGEPELIAEITDDMLEAAARNEQHLALLRRARLVSHMIVPLRARGRTLGTITFVTGQSRRRYDVQDLALAEDLARRAALAVDNARLYQEAQEALRIRDEFLSSVTHDLRTPLTAIRGRAQILLRRAGRDGGIAPDVMVEGLNAIDSVSGRMEGLVAELVDLSRLESGRPLELVTEPVDLLALVREGVADQERTTTARHQIRVASNETAVIGAWDGARLARVIANLLSNAVRYSPSGGTITVTVTREGEAADWARLTVHDQGVGIPARDLPHIFNRFHRGSNVVGRITGAGIGLAGVKQIVEQHGGTVTVESDEGVGTTVTVRLPLET